MKKVNYALLATAAASASWTVWYKLVIKRAMRSTFTWGPRWYVRFLAQLAQWLAEKIFHCTLDTNLKDLPDRQVMMGCHPHGVYMITAAFFGPRIMTDPANKPEWFVCVANLLFRIPGVSEFLTLVHGRSASRKVIKSLLDCGHSVGVVPGGIYEQIRTDPDVEAAYFPPNLGFIRMAIEHGVPLWPMYMFGENQLYGQNSLTRFANRWVKKYFGIGSLFVIGRFGLPWPVFKPTQLYMHYGNFVEVGEPDENPSDERVREVFLRYVAELRRIFVAHAASRLPPENAKKGLHIVWREHPDDPLLSKI